MQRETPIKELEAAIEHFYERYSEKRVALAAFLVGVFTIGLSYLGYALSGMVPVAIAAFGIAGVFSVYLILLFVVPPSAKLNESRALMCAAIHEPTRIKSIDKKGIKLADDTGRVRDLRGPEIEVWNTKIVPYFMQVQSEGLLPGKSRSAPKLTASERKYIEDLRKEVLEIEKRIASERKDLERARKEFEMQGGKIEESEAANLKKSTGG